MHVNLIHSQTVTSFVPFASVPLTQRGTNRSRLSSTPRGQRVEFLRRPWEVAVSLFVAFALTACVQAARLTGCLRRDQHQHSSAGEFRRNTHIESVPPSHSSCHVREMYWRFVWNVSNMSSKI